ncbi:citrate (Si)-synthase [candidate division KSB1 bacterium]|nr:MAG: citrate (Si)-synthase [candidate division KSB1 bacterium]
MDLKEKFQQKIEPMRERIQKMIKDHGDEVISTVTVRQAFGGVRGVKCLVCDTSNLDPMEGIRFRGYTIPELIEKLPKAPGGKQPLPEGIFYLLLIGELPTEEDVKQVTEEWRKRSELPEYLVKILDSLPRDMRPMTQFSSSVLVLHKDSIFSKSYREGISKYDLWKPMYEDVMNLLAKLPAIAAYVYRRTYKDNKQIEPDPNLDWGANFAHMMGIENPEYKELMRLYLFLHSDHESGNVSAHTTRLVGSALSDAYFALSAGLNGLAGPLHGLANEESLRWILGLREKFGGGVPTKEQVKQYVMDTLNSGHVVPGYGHAVLRTTDPRYIAQRKYALEYLPDDEVFQIVNLLYEVTPDLLRKYSKAKNPWPNVDAHSGCLQIHYGVKEYDFYPVLFGVSRAMGVLSQLIWARALGGPIERPKSITTDWILEQIKKNK